jgi:hypothetical protein
MERMIEPDRTYVMDRGYAKYELFMSVPVRPERTFRAAGMQFWNLSIPVVLP